MSPNLALFCTHTDVPVLLIDFHLHWQVRVLQTPSYLQGCTGHQEWTVTKIGNNPGVIYQGDFLVFEIIIEQCYFAAHINQ